MMELIWLISSHHLSNKIHHLNINSLLLRHIRLTLRLFKLISSHHLNIISKQFSTNNHLINFNNHLLSIKIHYLSINSRLNVLNSYRILRVYHTSQNLRLLLKLFLSKELILIMNNKFNKFKFHMKDKLLNKLLNK